ncbi:hypothetical protein MASR2M16_33870 [Thauera terpenica]
MGKQGVVLKHHADAPTFRCEVHARGAHHLAAQPYLARGHTLEAGYAAQHRGLAAAGRAEQAADLAFFEAE